MTQPTKFTPPGPLHTPVLFLIYKRSDTTRQVFEAIRQAKPPRLYLAADGPKSDVPGEAEKVQQARDVVLNGVDWDCEVKTLFRDKNLGCKYGVSGGIDWFFEHEEEGIILEDDTLPSQSFFWFCQELLEMYRSDSRIMSIVGYNLLEGETQKNSTDYLFSIIGFSWGWATWKQSWKCFDIDMKEWPTIKKNELNKYWPFNTTRNSIWDKCYRKEIDSWFYIWDFCKTINSGLSIVPCNSLIRNIGFGIDATHTKNNKGKRFKIVEKDIVYPLKHPQYIINNGKYENLFWRARNLERGLLIKIRNRLMGS